MHKVRQFKVNAKTLPGLGSVLTIANHRPENFNSQELGAGPRIALGTEGYGPSVILFHYRAIIGSSRVFFDYLEPHTQAKTFIRLQWCPRMESNH